MPAESMACNVPVARQAPGLSGNKGGYQIN
jgi:hypothetical protein